MKFLLNDRMKKASISYPENIRSGELSDTYTPTKLGVYVLPQGKINCIGLAARDAYAVYIYNPDSREPLRSINFGTPLGKGLYTFPDLPVPKDGILLIGVFTPTFKEIEGVDGRITREVDTLEYATIQRLAIGEYIEVGISPQRSLLRKSTAKSKTTLSGQVVADMGGYSYTTIEVEVKYKVDDFFLNQINEQYTVANNTGSIFAYGDNDPMFFDFLGDNFPFSKFYGVMQDKFMLQGAVKDKLYSIKMKLVEAF